MTYDPNWDIFRVVHGSRAYGTHREDSDRDEKGVCIPPRSYYTSPFKKFEQHETNDPDAVVYEIRKFCKLARDCNPNIIEVLYAEKKHILHMDSIGEELRENASIFLSQKAKFTFTGCAQSQLKRLRTHKRWNETAPTHPGTFNLPINKEQIKNIDNFCSIDSGKYPQHEDKEHVKAQFGDAKSFSWFHGKTYMLKMANYKSYQSWEENRNTERAVLEKEFGYDTKHAYHCIRLLRMGMEILETGEVLVYRPDWEELLSIKNGAWEKRRTSLLKLIRSMTPMKAPCPRSLKYLRLKSSVWN